MLLHSSFCWPSPTVKNQSKQREFYENFARKIRRAGLVRHHQVWTVSRGIKLYKDSFKGDHFVLWLMRSQNLDRNEALEAGQCLMDHRLIEPIGGGGGGTAAGYGYNLSPVEDIDNIPSLITGCSLTPNNGTASRRTRLFSTDRFYRLIDDEDHKMPLNMFKNNEKREDKPGENDNKNHQNEVAVAPQLVAVRPHRKISVRDFNARLCPVLDRIYLLVLSEDRRCVHLDLLDDCDTFADYKQLSLEANFVDVGGATVPERLAFFINMHNAILVHITHKFGLPGTIWQRRKYLYSTYYNIGGHLYSLQSIFNGILRGNRRGLGMLWKPFGEQDLRNEFLIDGGEPLAHFGLNNYTRSTPPIRTYSADNVYEELRTNARTCLASKEFLQVEPKTGHIRLAKLFKQYADDFGSCAEDMLCWIVRTMEGSEERARLTKVLSDRQYTVSYLPMDSDLNMTYGLDGLMTTLSDREDESMSIGRRRRTTIEDDENGGREDA